MSKTQENPFLNPKPKKVHFWGLWIPLIIVAAIIFIPVGLVMGLFFDTSHYDTGVKEGIEASELFPSVMNNLLDNCRSLEDPSIDLTITEQSLNQLLYSVADKLNKETIPAEVKNYVTVNQLDIQITDKDYLFDLEATGINFFKTRAQIRMHVTTDADIPSEIGNNEKGFIFDIVDTRIGRLGGVLDALPTIAKMTGAKINIGDLLKIDGINWTYDEANTRILYPYSTFQADITKMASFGEGLFSDLFSTFFEQNLIQFPHNKGYINGKIPLNEFKKNDNYYSDLLTIEEKETVDGVEKLMLNVKADQIESLLNGGILTEALATKHDLKLDAAALAVHKFLAFGTDFNSSNEVALINELATNNTFKALLGNKSVSDYSVQRKVEHFGPSNTGYVEDIIDNAQAKVTNMMDAASEADKHIGEGLDPEEIIRRILNGEDLPPELDSDNLKTVSLFKGIQGKILNSQEHAWYLYGGDNTTYYFDNTSTDWAKLYAKAYDSSTGTYEASDPGIRMAYVGNNIWSYDVPNHYDKISFGNGSESTDLLTLSPGNRYYNGSSWTTVPSSIVETPNTIRINDVDIHDLVKANTGIIGFGFPFLGKDSNGQYKYSYTMVDNIYPVTRVVNDKTTFALVFGLNLNGTETQLVLPCVKSESYAPAGENQFGMSFSIEDATMYYGNLEVPRVKETLKDLISGSSMTSDFFSIDDGAKSMSFNIDLSSLVTNGNFKTVHDHLTADPAVDEYGCDAKLFVNIIPSANAEGEVGTLGAGGFTIEFGYKRK